MAKRTKLPAKRSTTLSRRQAVKLLKPKHPPPLKPLKKRAAVKAVKAKPTNGRRKQEMTTKTYGSDDNGDKAKGAQGAPVKGAVPDAALTQEQVDAGVKAVFAHPGGEKISKPDDLVRSVDAAVHGYELKPAE